MSLRHDEAVGFAIFQMTAIPIVLLILAWLVKPAGGQATSDPAGNEVARKRDAHYLWAAKKLLLPPLAYFVSGALSWVLSFVWLGASMTLLGITTFAVMWYFISLIGHLRKRLLQDQAP